MGSYGLLLVAWCGLTCRYGSRDLTAGSTMMVWMREEARWLCEICENVGCGLWLRPS